MVCHFLLQCKLSEFFTMTCLSWVALYGMAHSFIELHKPLSHNKAVIHEGDRGAWHAVIHVFAKSWTQLNDWTTVFPMWIVTYHVCLHAGPSAPAFLSLSTAHTFTPCFLCLCASFHALLLLVGGHSIGHWISGLEGQEVISVCFPSPHTPILF